MKINAEMDIPIKPNHGPCVYFFSQEYQPIILRIRVEKNI